MIIRHMAIILIFTFVYGVSSTSVAAIIADNTSPTIQVQPPKETPSHAKWGKRAMVEVKKKYPHAEIYDYKHVGRQEKAHTSTETFHLWIREKQKSSKVTVNITFDSNSENIINVTVHPSNN